jgi:Ala-tRNA(Pro) deacylase
MGIAEDLRDRQIRFDSLLHRPAPSASRRAGTVGVPGDRVAKGVLVRAGDRFVLAVLASTRRIDWARLARALGEAEIRLATEEEVARIFHDCERGAIPPFGARYGLATVVEAGLADLDELVVESEMRHLDVRLGFADFLALERPLLARFADTPARRQAG